MSLGMRAMFANYAALQTTGHNISNANTEGYSRQQVELKTSGGQFTGAGFFGKGVDIASVTRSHDAFHLGHRERGHRWGRQRRGRRALGTPVCLPAVHVAGREHRV